MWLEAIYTTKAAGNIYSQKHRTSLIKEIISSILELILVQAAVDGH